MGEPWKIYQGQTEASFGSGSNPWEMSHYETSFAAATNGIETTGSVVSGGCSVYQMHGVSRLGVISFMQLFDLTGGPGTGYRPIASFPVMSASSQTFEFRNGKTLHNGLQMGWSSTYSTFTPVAGGSFYIDYKV